MASRFSIMKFVKDVVNNSIAIQDTIVRYIRKYRGRKFHVSHWKEITELKEATPVRDGISNALIQMYREAARFHYECISSMTDTIHPHDEPWLENLQSPVVIQLLKEKDAHFRKAVSDLIKAIEDDRSRAIERTLLARHTGQYGPTWIFDSHRVPGTQAYLYYNLLEQLEADDNVKGAIMHSRVTSYANLVGLSFSEAIRNGHSLTDALRIEKEMLIRQWKNPIDSQKRVMDKMGFRSFDTLKYMNELKTVLSPYIKKCMQEGVSYRNIIWIPTLIGDVHHIGQMAYNMCKDDMTMAIFEAVARCLERTLKANITSLSSLDSIPIFEITGTASAYIMHLDGITAEDVAYVINQRYRRLIQRNPVACQRENMNGLFVRYIRTGEKILAANPGKPQISGLRIDLSPVDNNAVIQDPASYTWAQLPITARFAAIIKFLDEPFMLISDPAWGPIWVCRSADPSHSTNRSPYYEWRR